jgi:uncharacterized protein
MAGKRLIMEVLKGKFGVCRLECNEEVPGWFLGSEFFSVTKTSEELSIVCSQHIIPHNVKCEKDWCILKVLGPLDFSLVGILASISNILAKNGISIFALSTYDTDYILVKEKDLDNSVAALSNENYEFVTK